MARKPFLICVHVDIRRGSDGRCLDCMKEAKRLDYLANPEKYRRKNEAQYARHKARIAAHRAKKYAADPSYVREKATEWYEANRVRSLATKARRYAENAEQIKVDVKAYLKRNPDVRKAIVHNRRARKLGNGGKHTAAQLRALAVAQNFLCACGCGVSIRDKYHIDHIVPLSRGGTSWIENIQLLTPTCNLRKHAKDHTEWLSSNSRKSYATEIGTEITGQPTRVIA